MNGQGSPRPQTWAEWVEFLKLAIKESETNLVFLRVQLKAAEENVAAGKA